MMNLQFTWEKQWILKRGFNVQKNYKFDKAANDKWKLLSEAEVVVPAV